MRGGNSAHGPNGQAGASNYNGTAGPYALTICGIPLNPVPPRWQDILPDFGP